MFNIVRLGKPPNSEDCRVHEVYKGKGRKDLFAYVTVYHGEGRTTYEFDSDRYYEEKDLAALLEAMKDFKCRPDDDEPASSRGNAHKGKRS